MKRRTKKITVYLSPATYKTIEESAYRNCRTVSQEGSFLLESEVRKPAPFVAPPDYMPVPGGEDPADAEAYGREPDASKEEKSAALVRATNAGFSEGQIKVLRLSSRSTKEFIAKVDEQISAAKEATPKEKSPKGPEAAPKEPVPA